MLYRPAVAATSDITLSSSTQNATAGYFQLSWEAEPPLDAFVLQESTREDFSTSQTIYRGPDLATVISGRPDSTYYYRVHDDANPRNTSNTAEVMVAHHPLRHAFAFFGVGAVVFAATLLLILRGNRQR